MELLAGGHMEGAPCCDFRYTFLRNAPRQAHQES